MDRPLNPEPYRKQSLSLHRAYFLVGFVGAVMLKLFFNTHQGQAKAHEAVTELIMRLDELFAAFRSQLDELEAVVKNLVSGQT